MTAHPPAHEVPEAWHDEVTNTINLCPTEKHPYRGYVIITLAVAAWLALLAFAVFVWLLTSALLASGAYAHEAPKSVSQPLGWTYGWECCSIRDCAPVEKSGIGETSAGYVIRQTGEVIAYGDTRIKRSKDELYHRCTPAGDMDAARSICLYVPDRGF
jgi:hypothetical protein